MAVKTYAVPPAALASMMSASQEVVSTGLTGLAADTQYQMVDVDDAAVFTTLAPADGTIRTFNTDGSRGLRFTMPAGLTGYTMGGYAERPATDSFMFRTQLGHMQLDATGLIRVLVYDGAGDLAGSFIASDVMEATGLTHVAFKADLSTNPMTGTLYKNGVQISVSNLAANPHNGTVQDGSDFWLFMRDLSDKVYTGDFKEVFFDEGLGIDVAAVFGTTDMTTLNPTYLLGGPGQRALPIGSSQTPNMNAAQSNGTGTLVFDQAVTAGNEPFSEVV